MVYQQDVGYVKTEVFSRDKRDLQCDKSSFVIVRNGIKQKHPNLHNQVENIVHRIGDSFLFNIHHMPGRFTRMYQTI